jgi:antitoxin (DNA-binding transcriptional repressor) of toxin-antitoxin stability system
MQRMSATEFKAKCLAKLAEVERTRQGITILKRGKPIAQLLPVLPDEEGYPQRSLRGTVEIVGDIVAPALAVDDWEAEGR